MEKFLTVAAAREAEERERTARVRYVTSSTTP
jgi:hypothetical protein